MAQPKRLTAYEVADMIKTLGLSAVRGRFIGTSITGEIRQSIYEIPKSDSEEGFRSITNRAIASIDSYCKALIEPAKLSGVEIDVSKADQLIDSGMISINSEKNSYQIFFRFQPLMGSVIVGIGITKKE